MNPALTVALFFLLAAIWLALAFLPGLMELRRRTDVTPLRVVPESEMDIRHFAHRFRARIEQELGRATEQVRAAGRRAEGRLSDGSAYLVVPAGESPELSADELGKACSERIFVATEALSLPGGTAYLGEIYAGGRFTGGSGSIFRALLAEGDCELGAESSSLRWLHATGALIAGDRCALYGRVSADARIRLAAGSSFERLSAPLIEFGEAAQSQEPAPSPETLRPLMARELPGVIELKAGRCLVIGDLELPERSFFELNLVVKGRLVIGAGSHLLGSLKAGEGLSLGDQVRVEGALVSARSITLGAGCRVSGPILAEKDARIGAGSLIASAARPTTLSAEWMQIETGTRVHGSVWAHRWGVVNAAAALREAAHA